MRIMGLAMGVAVAVDIMEVEVALQAREQVVHLMLIQTLHHILQLKVTTQEQDMSSSHGNLLNYTAH